MDETLCPSCRSGNDCRSDARHALFARMFVLVRLRSFQPPPTPTPTQARPAYHLTPASGWINDPVRPLWMGGIWNLWVLWNTDFPTGNGTAWRRYTSSDLVNWTDQGVSIPKYTTAYGDVWVDRQWWTRTILQVTVPAQSSRL